MPHRHLVLIVDDDADIRRSVQAVFESAGDRVAVACDGWEGLKVLEQLCDGEPPCAILLDLRMPRMDGFEFRAAQLACPSFAEVPVALFTAFCDTPGVDAMRVQAVFRKPTDVDDVVAFVARHCRAA
jgi:CheY-like chemotaxis protein